MTVTTYVHSILIFIITILLSLNFNRQRLRLGAIGPKVAELIPEAVDLVPKRTLPPMEKGGKPIIQYDVPVVNEQMLFMYGIGATQEIGKIVENLDQALEEHTEKLLDLHGEMTELEYLLSRATDGSEELRIQAAAAEAKIVQTETDTAIQMARIEEEYISAQKDAELAQIKRSEELTLARLRREDEAAKERSIEAMKKKFETSQKAEANRLEAERMISTLQYEKDLALQKASEKMKAETEKVNTSINSTFLFHAILYHQLIIPYGS